MRVIVYEGPVDKRIIRKPEISNQKFNRNSEIESIVIRKVVLLRLQGGKI